jgi:hypothetical protein
MVEESVIEILIIFLKVDLNFIIFKHLNYT